MISPFNFEKERYRYIIGYDYIINSISLHYSICIFCEAYFLKTLYVDTRNVFSLASDVVATIA